MYSKAKNEKAIAHAIDFLIFTFTFSFFLLPFNFVAHAFTLTSPGANNISSGLVGWWTMDGKDVVNGVALDKSGNGNNGNLQNISTSTFYALGKIGQAFNFDGVNDYVDMGNTNNMLTSDWTVSAWVKTATSAASVIVGKRDSSVTTNAGYQLFLDTGGFAGSAFGDGSAGRVRVTSTKLINDNTWHLVMLVLTRTANSVIYVDGIPAGSGSASISGQQGSVNTPTYTFRVGSQSVTNTLNFPGSVDDVRVYNRALSQTEITQLYNQGASTKQSVSIVQPPFTTGLIGWWTMDGKDTPWTSSTAATTLDKSGGGKTGTLTNMSKAIAPVPGAIGQGLKFDGVDDYVDISASSFSFPTNEATLNMWVKLNLNVPVVDIKSGLIAFNASSLNNHYPYTDGLAYLAVFRAARVDSITLNASIDRTKWHMLTITTTPGTNGWKLYQNGILVTQTTGESTVTVDATKTFGKSSTFFLNGALDDARVYNRALSQAEITQLYNQGGSKNLDVPIAQPTLTTGLAGYWTFDGKDVVNGVALDKSGNGNNANLFSISTSSFYSLGKIGQAFKFDGVNDYAKTKSNLTIGSTFSISTWVKPNAAQAAYNRILETAYATAFYLGANTTATSYDFIVNASSNLESCIGGTITVGKWTLLTGTYDGTNSRLYVDGSLVCTFARASPSVSLPLYIGTVYVSPGGSNVWNGTIDDVRYYTRVLSQAEITQLLNQGR